MWVVARTFLFIFSSIAERLDANLVRVARSLSCMTRGKRLEVRKPSGADSTRATDLPLNFHPAATGVVSDSVTL